MLRLLSKVTQHFSSENAAQDFTENKFTQVHKAGLGNFCREFTFYRGHRISDKRIDSELCENIEYKNLPK